MSENKSVPNCIWTQRLADADDNLWSTSCGHEFQLIEGKPSDNHFDYCVYCGSQIVERIEDE